MTAIRSIFRWAVSAWFFKEPRKQAAYAPAENITFDFARLLLKLPFRRSALPSTNFRRIARGSAPFLLRCAFDPLVALPTWSFIPDFMRSPLVEFAPTDRAGRNAFLIGRRVIGNRRKQQWCHEKCRSHLVRLGFFHAIPTLAVTLGRRGTSAPRTIKLRRE
jgi:hypothetical protein